MSVVSPLKKLTGNRAILANLAERYTARYPNRAFTFILDGQELTIGTANPVTITIRNAEQTLDSIFTKGSIALGDAFVDGNIDGDLWAIAEWARFMLRVSQDKRLRSGLSLGAKTRLAKAIMSSFLEPKSGIGNQQDVNHHYSLEAWGVSTEDSNRFFRFLLGPTMVYSCGWWHNGAKNLEQAQYDKFGEYATLLDLKRGNKLIDLGCGWGTQALSYATHGIDVTMLTLADAQIEHIEAEIDRLKLKDRARVLKMDMLNIDQFRAASFDAILSIGAIEHVADFDQLFSKAKRILRPEGNAIWHTMYNKEHVAFDAWMAHRMWPGVQIPSEERLIHGIQRQRFHFLEFIRYPHGSYSRTFREWLKNFIANYHEMSLLIPGTLEQKTRFMRAFAWYLACCTIVYEVHMDVGAVLCTPTFNPRK